MGGKKLEREGKVSFFSPLLLLRAASLAMVASSHPIALAPTWHGML